MCENVTTERSKLLCLPDYYCAAVTGSKSSFHPVDITNATVKKLIEQGADFSSSGRRKRREWMRGTVSKKKFDLDQPCRRLSNLNYPKRGE